MFRVALTTLKMEKTRPCNTFSAHVTSYPRTPTPSSIPQGQPQTSHYISLFLYPNTCHSYGQFVLCALHVEFCKLTDNLTISGGRTFQGARKLSSTARTARMWVRILLQIRVYTNIFLIFIFCCVGEGLAMSQSSRTKESQIMSLNQGYTNFPKIAGLPQNIRLSKGDMKKVLH
jgi:hypothetical protein